MAWRQAVLWIAEGIFLRDDYRVPSQAPRLFRLTARSRVRVLDPGELPSDPNEQRLEFRLERDPKGGERVHYFLSNRPPRGYRWLVVGKDVRVERISEREERERAAREAARALAEAVYAAQEGKHRQIDQLMADALFPGYVVGLNVWPKYINGSLEGL